MPTTKPLLGVDLETNGLHRGCSILGVGLATEEGGRVRASSLKWSSSIRDSLQTMFDQHTLVFHNASFDVRVLREHGFRVTDYHDTQVMAYAVSTEHESYSLNACLERAGLAKKVEFETDWATAEWDERMAAYCEQDVRQTLVLFLRLWEELGRDKLAMSHYMTVDRPFIDCIVEMQSVGMYLDPVRLPKVARHLSKKVEGFTRVMQRIAGFVNKGEVNYKNKEPMGYVGPDGMVVMTGSTTVAVSQTPYCLLADKDKVRKQKGEMTLPKKYWVYDREKRYDHCAVEPFNPNSGQQVADKLVELYGWEPTTFTDSGQPSTSGEVLAKLDYPLARMMSAYLEANKIYGSFVQKFTELKDDHNILRGSFNQTVTRTGRLSSSEPNLQNVPTRGTYGHAIRALVTVPNENFRIVGIDLSNIEGRVLAHYLSDKMGDPVMAEVFRRGVDFHTENAFNWGFVEMFSDAPTAAQLREDYDAGVVTKNHPVIKKARDVAKTALYAVLYGAGDAKLGNGDSDLGARIRAILYERAPSIPALKEKVWKHMRKKGGLIHSLWGRRLYYPDIVEKKAMRAAQEAYDADPTHAKVRSVKWEAKRRIGAAERQSFNALLQGSAADIIKLLTVKSMPIARKYGAVLAAQVHDECLYYVRQEVAQQFADELTALFTNDWAMTHCPCEGEASVGTSWHDVH